MYYSVRLKSVYSSVPKWKFNVLFNCLQTGGKNYTRTNEQIAEVMKYNMYHMHVQINPYNHTKLVFYSTYVFLYNILLHSSKSITIFLFY